jgi:hypothetical protein
MDKMHIYQASREVPAEAKKAFNNGSFSGTDINPMWRIKKLTELFGPCGIGWYYEVTSERAELHNDTTMAIVDLNLYIKVDGEWSKPIYGTGGNTLVKTTKQGLKASDEGYKMALTDALSVACKALGIGADVYFEKDTTKYTQYAAAEDAVKPGEKVDLPKMGSWNPRNAISIWCHSHGLKMDAFADIRKALVAGGIVKDIKSSDLTPEDFDQLCHAIEANYPDQLRAPA